MKCNLRDVLAYPLALSLAFCLAAGCAGRAGTPPARSAAEQEQADREPGDGGLPTPAPSTKKGIIVPSDVGIGTQPATTTPSAGTNSSSMGTPSGPASN